MPPRARSWGGLARAGSAFGFFSDSEQEYRTTRETVDELEVPPDLTSSSIQDARNNFV